MQQGMNPAAHKPIRGFAIGLTSVFALLELVNIFNHAMWRDELQVWMIARHSHSIAELLSLKKYDGHPDAWFLVVYAITKFTSHPVWMQIVHVFVAGSTAYLVARFSPFTRIQKILIIFGYFLFLSTRQSAANTPCQSLRCLLSVPFFARDSKKTIWYWRFSLGSCAKPAFTPC